MESQMVLPVYTSYFANKNIYNDKYVVINITRSQPRWIADEFPTYHNMVPSMLTLASWSRSNKDERAMVEYIERYYYTRLCIYGDDSPDIHLDNMMAFTRDVRSTHGEKPIVFTCYETIGKFCHRLVYTTWLKLTTGIIIPELGYNPKEPTKDQEIITNTLMQLIKGGHSQ